MNNSIIQKIIKPSNCVLGFGIPTSKNDFFRDQSDSNKDFAKMFNGMWGKYYHQFIKDLERVEPLLKETGLNVKHNLKLSDYQSLFEGNDVVILFSHWKNDRIEFSDGLINIEDIIQAIPDEFTGIIDLCVCHPNKLAMKIRENKPNCLVRYIPRAATPSSWLKFYSIFFTYLKQKDLTYLTALEDVISEFLK